MEIKSEPIIANVTDNFSYPSFDEYLKKIFFPLWTNPRNFCQKFFELGNRITFKYRWAGFLLLRNSEQIYIFNFVASISALVLEIVTVYSIEKEITQQYNRILDISNGLSSISAEERSIIYSKTNFLVQFWNLDEYPRIFLYCCSAYMLYKIGGYLTENLSNYATKNCLLASYRHNYRSIEGVRRHHYEEIKENSSKKEKIQHVSLNDNLYELYTQYPKLLLSSIRNFLYIGVSIYNSYGVIFASSQSIFLVPSISFSCLTGYCVFTFQKKLEMKLASYKKELKIINKKKLSIIKDFLSFEKDFRPSKLQKLQREKEPLQNKKNNILCLTSIIHALKDERIYNSALNMILKIMFITEQQYIPNTTILIKAFFKLFYWPSSKDVVKGCSSLEVSLEQLEIINSMLRLEKIPLNNHNSRKYSGNINRLRRTDSTIFFSTFDKPSSNINFISYLKKIFFPLWKEPRDLLAKIFELTDACKNKKFLNEKNIFLLICFGSLLILCAEVYMASKLDFQRIKYYNHILEINTNNIEHHISNHVGLVYEIMNKTPMISLLNDMQKISLYYHLTHILCQWGIKIFEYLGNGFRHSLSLYSYKTLYRKVEKVNNPLAFDIRSNISQKEELISQYVNFDEHLENLFMLYPKLSLSYIRNYIYIGFSIYQIDNSFLTSIQHLSIMGLVTLASLASGYLIFYIQKKLAKEEAECTMKINNLNKERDFIIKTIFLDDHEEEKENEALPLRKICAPKMQELQEKSEQLQDSKNRAKFLFTWIEKIKKCDEIWELTFSMIAQRIFGIDGNAVLSALIFSKAIFNIFHWPSNKDIIGDNASLEVSIEQLEITDNILNIKRELQISKSL